jgi:hypothetical protein
MKFWGDYHPDRRDWIALALNCVAVFGGTLGWITFFAYVLGLR